MKKLKIFVYGIEDLSDKTKLMLIEDLRMINSLFDNNKADNTKIPEDANLILVIGGDGKMLDAINNFWQFNIPFCGINYGHIGFLLNDRHNLENVLQQMINQQFNRIKTNLLQAKIFNADNQELKTVYAFADFVLERTEPQAAKIKITVDNKVYHDPLTCDGIIISAPQGSTGHNASAHGIILPIDSNSYVITGICPLIFHHWHTSQLPKTAVIKLEPVERAKRPVRLTADGKKINDFHHLEISMSDQQVTMLFVESQDFHLKNLRYQFNKI